MMKRWCAIAAAGLALAGCGGGGQGNVEFSSWGEEYIEKEIPSSVFADGWSVHYSKFLVVIGKIEIADEAGLVGAEMTGSKLINHVSPGVKAIETFRDLEAKAWTKVSYQIAPADDATTLGDGATDADLTMMKEKGYSVYVEAEATKDAIKKTYKWGFDLATAYNDCKGDKDGKETFGVLVTNGGTDQVELTIHGDHLYYDDLQAANAKVRFNAIAAADKNDDGEITLEELGAVKLTDIDPADGAYGTGAAGDVDDLRAFVSDLSRTVGHFRGEGECFAGDPK
ncbi:putative lipoprotein [Minicystis rosea]|nr:putative lipoprotein [Minicystis rosea]